MPFVDKSTLTYPATNSFPVRKWLDQSRAPTSSDYKNFQIFDLWIWEGQSAWILIDKTATAGTWVQMASSGTGILTITGDTGGAVGPDGNENINLISAAHLTVTGDAGTNTLTISLDDTIVDQFDADSGSAIASGGILNVIGAGGISTTGAGDTITITAGPTVGTFYFTDAGTAVPSLNTLNILGGTGVSTTGVGATVTINAETTVATTYTCDTGTATPSANNLNVVGAGSASTSGSGDTVTVTCTGGGLTWNEVTVVGPTQMAVDNGYITNNASRVELTLPLTSSLGSVIEIAGKGAGGWQINQNAGQSILELGVSSTTGAGGTVSSVESGCTVSLVCITADTTWRVLSSTGNLTFV